ncbi:ABC transporter permease [candidate division KSB1 bacterium]|nr:ABC transporter permease [candidate division KSB1 bacterium]
MIIPKLAYKNIVGAGLRTWLNVFVLSFAYVAIIWTQGLYEGMNRQASRAMIDYEVGGGQYWVDGYDPYDPFTFDDAHEKLPLQLRQLIDQDRAAPILVARGTIYPKGRIMSVQLKGIDPSQQIIGLPSSVLDQSDGGIPALIGSRMAKNSGLTRDDYVTLRWRDVNGTFDALDIHIVDVMRTTVSTIDVGQIWLPLDSLRKMTRLENEATIVVIDNEMNDIPTIAGWEFKDHDFLLKDIREVVQMKTVSASIIYLILLVLAMIAIFDTQVLSVFKRRKEIGTLMALGMTRWRVVKLFTLEGAMHGIIAIVIAAIYGIPLLIWFSKQGWAMPQSIDDYGFAIGEKLFPSYSLALIVGTIVLVLLTTTIVSYLPSSKISKINPTDALKGKSL